MNARDVFRLVEEPSTRKYRGWRRVAGLLFASVGEPVDPGGDHIVVIDRHSGKRVGTIETRFGDQGTLLGRVEEDLWTLTPEKFRSRWLAATE